LCGCCWGSVSLQGNRKGKGGCGCLPFVFSDFLLSMLRDMQRGIAERGREERKDVSTVGVFVVCSSVCSSTCVAVRSLMCLTACPLFLSSCRSCMGGERGKEHGLRLKVRGQRSFSLRIRKQMSSVFVVCFLSFFHLCVWVTVASFHSVCC